MRDAVALPNAGKAMAGAWTELTVDVVKKAMPTDLAALYQTWLDANLAKANRLSELVAEAVETYRQAVAANPLNVMDAATNTVPTTGFRHALNLVIFNLGMEMGVQFAPQVYTLTTRGDIWLRMVQSGTIKPVETTEGEGTPSYQAPERKR